MNTPVHEDEHNNNTIYNTNNNTIYNYRVYYDEQVENCTEENKPFLEAYKAFIEYLFGNNEFKQPFKDFLKVERQLSLDEFKSLSEKSRNGLGWILVKMLNKPSYIKGKKSIYLTLNDWIERDNRNNKTEQQ